MVAWPPISQTPKKRVRDFAWRGELTDRASFFAEDAERPVRSESGLQRMRLLPVSLTMRKLSALNGALGNRAMVAPSGLLASGRPKALAGGVGITVGKE